MNKKQKKNISYLLISGLLINIASAIFVNTTNANYDIKNDYVSKIETFNSKVNLIGDKIKGRINTKQYSKLSSEIQDINQLKEEYILKIKTANSNSDIEEYYNEIRKRAILKLYAGITKDYSIKDNISKNIKITDINKVSKVLTDSLKKDNNIELLIESNDFSGVENYLKGIDKNIKVIKNVGNQNILKIIIPNDSIIKTDFLEEIDNGIIPDKLIKYNIIKPISVKLNESDYVNGEDLEDLWGITTIGADNYQEGLSENGKKITVGIIDTGIDYNHSDLADNIYTNEKEIEGNGIDDDDNGYIDDIHGYDFVNDDNDAFDDHGHGTHVSGSVGAVVNNEGVFGVNSNTSLVPLKMLTEDGYGSSYDVIDAITYAADNGINVINMSLGGDGDPEDSGICDAIDYALDKGTISIVAAGNEDKDTSETVPGGCKNAITVAAIDENYERADFSNYGDKIDISAPGVNILSTTPDNNYETWSGTSMATPYVTGTVSAILAYKDMSLDDIKALLKDTSIDTTSESDKKIEGLINFSAIMDNIGVSNDDENTDDSEDENTDDSEDENLDDGDENADDNEDENLDDDDENADDNEDENLDDGDESADDNEDENLDDGDESADDNEDENLDDDDENTDDSEDENLDDGDERNYKKIINRKKETIKKQIKNTKRSFFR